jgi:hypothetical protein
LALGDEAFGHGVAQGFYSFNQWGVKAEKARILPDSDAGDAYLAGKVALVFGKAGFDHAGVFFGPEDGIPVGLGRFGADPAGFVRCLAFPNDGNEPVIPLSLLGNEGGELP